MAKDTAAKACTSAMIILRALVVTAPPWLGEELRDLSKTALINRCLALRPGQLDTPLAAAKHALRSLARRWRDLSAKIKEHETVLAELTRETTSQLVDAFGIGLDTAAGVLVVAGDNPHRIRTETAWAKLCGVAPVLASSGITTRHRLNRGGHRQANAALYRTIIVRMQHHEPTRLHYSAHRRGPDQERDHPLPQAVLGS